jgi:hypothetical protein
MVRRDAFEAAGGYRDACRFWEDVDLYLRLARLGRIAVVAEPLVRYRHADSSVRRARADADEVEMAYDLMYSSMDAWISRRSYDVSSRKPGARLEPRVFVALGSLDLWAGQRPRALAPLLGRARLRADGATALALGWATWALASPGSLRASLRMRNRLRDMRGAELIYEWAPGRPARALA